MDDPKKKCEHQDQKHVDRQAQRANPPFVFAPGDRPGAGASLCCRWSVHILGIPPCLAVLGEDAAFPLRRTAGPSEYAGRPTNG
ncbi:MAG: hypothetical protein Kow00129_04480 [Thermoleophilia bacterium]